MVPRVEMVGVPIGISLANALSLAVESHHAHLPVHRGNLDDIVRVVNVLDLLRARNHEGHWRLEEVMRPALLVPETVAVDVLLGKMRDEGQQLAILVDEYGGTAGLGTVHDLVEELVGPIPDLEESGPGEVLPDGSIVLSDLAPIHAVNERFGLHLPSGSFTRWRVLSCPG
jgi:magnesium and cobalt transporter